MTQARFLIVISFLLFASLGVQAQALQAFVVKTKPMRYLRGPNHTLGLELVFDNRFTLDMMVHRELVWDFNYSDPSGFGNFETGNGYGVYVAPRIYLKETAPRRWYIAMAVGSQNYNIDNAWTFTGSGSSTTFSVEGNLKETLFLYGFQGLMGGVISFDVNIGLGYGWSTEYHEYKEGSRSGFPNGSRRVSRGRTLGQSNIAIGYYWSRNKN